MQIFQVNIVAGGSDARSFESANFAILRLKAPGSPGRRPESTSLLNRAHPSLSERPIVNKLRSIVLQHSEILRIVPRIFSFNLRRWAMDRLMGFIIVSIRNLADLNAPSDAPTSRHIVRPAACGKKGGEDA